MATTDNAALDSVGDVPDKPEPAPPEKKQRGHSKLYWFIFAVLVVLAAILVLFLGWLPRHKRQQEINRQAQERTQSVPKVEALKVLRGPGMSELMIPGTTLAYTEAYI